MSVALWLLVCLPAVVGSTLCLVGVAGWRVADGVAVVLGSACATAVLAAAALVAWGRPRVSVSFIAGSDFAFGVDGLSALMVLMVAVVTVAVLVFAAADVSNCRARFFGLMLLFVAAVLLTATAITLPTLLFAWEIMGATSWALIGFRWRDEDRVASGAVAFLTTRAADLGLYLAAGAAVAGGAGLSLADLPAAGGRWRDVAAAGVLVAGLGKAAQLPFSFWLSRAMQGPSAVSALLHSAAMVAMGGYLLLRAQPLLAATGWAATATAWAGAATAVGLGFVALAQQDLKQLLAASTAAQLGFVVLAAGLGAVEGGAVQLIAHAAVKAALFLAAGAWLSALGTKALPELTGVARRWPFVGGAAVFAAAALAGLAPLSLWATKDEVLATARASSPALYAVGVLAVGLAAGYAARIVVVILARHRPVRPPVQAEGPGTGRVPAAVSVALAPLAAGAVALGVLALPPLVGGLGARFGLAQPREAGPLDWAISAAVALVVFAAVAVAGARDLAAVARPRVAGVASGWLGLAAATQIALVRPTLSAAGALARFDERLHRRGVAAVVTAGLGYAQLLGRFDDRGLRGLVEALAAGVRRLGGLARRPQSGLLHQYYAQVVIVLGAAILVLVAVI